MVPFRGARALSSRCGVGNPDTFSTTGERVCRGCAGALEAAARLDIGKGRARVAAVVALVSGIALCFFGVLLAVGIGVSRSAGRLVGLVLGLGIGCIVIGVARLRGK
jgi:hypothetical protein